MARKKKKRSGLRNFSNVNIKLNIPWNPRGLGNKSFFRIIEKNPELNKYLGLQKKLDEDTLAPEPARVTDKRRKEVEESNLKFLNFQIMLINY